MNILSIHFNKIIKRHIISLFFILTTAFSAYAQENQQGYIADDLTIFMHAGPGTKYRILGTISAGSQIQITGKESNNYSEIVDEKSRVTWVETKYITHQPGLRFVVDELNSKLTNGNDYSAKLDGEVNELKNNIDILMQEKNSLQIEFNNVQQLLTETKSQLKGQDTSIKKQWFFNGAIVLGIGLILGLILPKFFARRRSSMDNWS